MLSKDTTIINGMVRTKDSLKVKDADRNLYIEKEGLNYNGYVLGVSGEYPQYIMKKHGVPLEDIMAYAKSNGLTITDLKVRDSKTGDARNGMIRTKDSSGEEALNKCRHDLFPVANELALIASSSIYDNNIRKAAKEAEQLVDKARHILFNAV